MPVLSNQGKFYLVQATTRSVPDVGTAKPEEITAAKSGWSQSRTVTRAQDGSLAGTLNNYLFIKRDLNWDAGYEQKVLALTPEQINAAVKKYLVYEKINIIKAGDFVKAKEKMQEKK